jgi:hypothetical protein
MRSGGQATAASSSTRTTAWSVPLASPLVRRAPRSESVDGSLAPESSTDYEPKLPPLLATRRPGRTTTRSCPIFGRPGRSARRPSGLAGCSSSPTRAARGPTRLVSVCVAVEPTIALSSANSSILTLLELAAFCRPKRFIARQACPSSSTRTRSPSAHATSTPTSARSRRPCLCHRCRQRQSRL